MAEEYSFLFLKIPYCFSILTPTPPPVLRISVIACVTNRDYLESPPIHIHASISSINIGKGLLDSPLTILGFV